jgi:3-methyladenine DNA glycosylase/8-oxoguanine DNA glycosylase
MEQALEELQELRGVGPWTASHMLLRGASAQDALPLAEPRVLRAFTLAYQRPESDFARCAEAWRPLRMWASIALVRNLGRLGQWAAVPSDFKRRGRAA